MLAVVAVVVQITSPALLELLLERVEQAVVVQVLSILVVMQVPVLQILVAVAVVVDRQVFQIQMLLVLAAQVALASSSLNTTHPYNPYSHSKVLASG
jgi:hypothetical protein